MEENLIGYILTKPEYVGAACQIEGYNVFGESIKDGKVILLDEYGNNRRPGFERLKRAGVLDLWFEPVYEESKPSSINKKDKLYLEWLYERLVHVHDENENYDYMVRFKKIIG